MKPADAYILRRHPRPPAFHIFLLGVAVGYILALVVVQFG